MLPTSSIKANSARVLARVYAISWRDLAVSAGPIVLVIVAALWAGIWYVSPAPPRSLTITAGPAGSIFMATAEKYRAILAKSGIKLEVVASEGSLQNLERLNDPTFKADIGFVQGGVADGASTDGLVSLGSIFNEPLAVFYRRHHVARRLTDFKGMRIAVGRVGSGSHMLALSLLKANGIVPGGPTRFVDLSGEAAAKALIDNQVDVAFLMGDSASPAVMRTLLWTPHIRLLDFSQADAYVLRFPYLNKLELPMGVFDIGKNTPRETISVIGPVVELVARDSLHPALSDLLIEAAREVHGGATLLQKAGQFPTPSEHEFHLSDDAVRYYKSGKGFFYRALPFWLASLLDRTAVVLVPILVLLIPGLRLVPLLYRWRIRSRIYRWYGALISLERNAYVEIDSDARRGMMKRLDEIEGDVNKMKMPLAFADQFYVLREHIRFVRDRLERSDAPVESPPAMVL